MKAIIIDGQTSGISGNMLLGALIDLGGDIQILYKAAEWVKKNIPWCKNVKVLNQQVNRSNFQATWIEFEINEERTHVNGVKFREYLSKLATDLKLTEKGKNLCLKAIDALLAAESKAHGVSIEKVHLHEAGSVDTLLDIFGSISLLEQMKLLDSDFFATSLSVGNGRVKTEHGELTIPAPATLEILKEAEIKYLMGPINFELATPTGVALLSALITGKISDQVFTPLKIGYGAGTKDFDNHPNILRLVIADKEESSLYFDSVEVIETNVDDVTGEILGYTLSKLIKEGAYDATAIPSFSKKNRPSYLVQVLCSSEQAEKLASILIKELGTLGVRRRTSIRHKLNRTIHFQNVSIDGVSEKIRVKYSVNKNKSIVNIKPEYEDVKKIAEKYSKSFKDIFNLALEQANKELLKNRKIVF
ncbi:MAG: nickel pincer cofactor biosynthesis protein LarC [Candidatus Ranarchaeia archaeon]